MKNQVLQPAIPHDGAARFAVTLLRWFAVNGRDLPWRHTRDAYTVWLSEVILQQTRIDQGRAYWERFIDRWPTVEQLAAATEDEVLRQWQGLGYYSRARHLLQAARQIAAAGHFPDTFATLRQLPGVGDYTAAAVASIAFHQPQAVVDGNVYRLLARHYAIDTPINSPAGKRLFAALAQSLMDSLRPTDPSPIDEREEYALFNQAMMDFGAMVCTPLSPRCSACPLVETCEGLRMGRVGELPVKQKTTRVQTRHLDMVYLRCQRYTAIRRRPAGDIWQGLWEPYMPSATPTPESMAGLRLLCRGVRHVLTHRVLLADFYLWESAERPSLPQDYVWVEEKDLDGYAKPRLFEKLIEMVS